MYAIHLAHCALICPCCLIVRADTHGRTRWPSAAASSLPRRLRTTARTRSPSEVVPTPATPSSTSRGWPFSSPDSDHFSLTSSKSESLFLKRTVSTDAGYRQEGLSSAFAFNRVTSKWLSARTRGCLRERRESRRRRSTLSRERVCGEEECRYGTWD